MKLAMIGATGITGTLVLDEAARRGHALTVLVRDPARLSPDGPTPDHVITGDGADAAAVRSALVGQDAVLVMISSRGTRQPVTSQVARTVVSAAAANDVPRLVATSTYGMVATRPLLVAPALRRVLATSFREQARADEVIRTSGLDWTILRATRLTDTAASGNPRVTPELLQSGPFSLSRADLAHTLLDVVEHHLHSATTLNITGGRS